MVEIKYPPGFGFLESIDKVNWELWLLCGVVSIALMFLTAYLVVKACEKLSE